MDHNFSVTFSSEKDDATRPLRVPLIQRTRRHRPTANVGADPVRPRDTGGMARGSRRSPARHAVAPVLVRDVARAHTGVTRRVGTKTVPVRRHNGLRPKWSSTTCAMTTTQPLFAQCKVQVGNMATDHLAQSNTHLTQVNRPLRNKLRVRRRLHTPTRHRCAHCRHRSSWISRRHNLKVGGPRAHPCQHIALPFGFR